MTDTLQTLLRLRRLAVDKARRGLADCLRQETVAEEKMRDLAAEIDRETDAVCRSAGDDRMVENFALWLRRARVEQDAAAGALLTAQTHMLEARAVLTAGREAVEVVESLIAQRDADRNATLLRQEQAILDEAGQGRGRPAYSPTKG
jgi:flagellar export protein FliJ